MEVIWRKWYVKLIEHLGTNKGHIQKTELMNLRFKIWKVCLHVQCCPACLLTHAFLPRLSCCHRHYQLIQTSVPCAWLWTLLVPVAYWIFIKIAVAMSQNVWTNTCSPMLYAILHSVRCLRDCKLMTLQHLVVPPFTLPVSRFMVVHISNCCVFFWIPCTSRFPEYFKQVLKLFNKLLNVLEVKWCYTGRNLYG